MSNFVSLDDAAKKLGVSVDELVEMLSRGDIFGYRDGNSWKFKPEEIERVAGELMGNALDEDPAGSSLLVGLSDSELEVAGSDVSSEGSDVRLVADDDDDLKLADSDDDDDELSVPDDGEEILSGSGISVAGGSAAGSDLSLADSDLEIAGSDLELAGSGIGSSGNVGGSDAASEIDLAAESGVLGSDINLAESGLITGDSNASGAIGSDLELSGEDDLVLGSGSDLALGTDSGINLMSPADSGISLEDEPLDLAASGISGLDIASEGSDVQSPSAGGSAVDFQQDEEFQLSPSGAIDVDDDSGSQVIELEDSSEFGEAAVALPANEGFDAFADVDGGGGLEQTEALGAPAASTGSAAVAASPEVPYTTLQVLILLGILLLMSMSGILVTDVVRNMWASAAGESNITTGITSMVLSAFGQ
ncbi:MAG: helix-turn-helix domain-containing protein [Planctomycetota bacterium]